jgi:hypothetical protein
MRLAALVEAPTRFRLLNRPRDLYIQEFSIAEGEGSSAVEAEDAIE